MKRMNHIKVLGLRFFLCFLFLIILYSGKSQKAYHHISDTDLYSFLDELATLHIIDLNTCIKPYSRKEIAVFLQKAILLDIPLPSSIQNRLNFYSNEFALEMDRLKVEKWQVYQRDTLSSVHLLPPEVSYKDTLFSAVVRPVYGIRSFSSGNDNFWVSYGGAEAITYIDNNWSVYFSLRDNYQKDFRLSSPSFLTQELGGTYKSHTSGKGGEFSEMRGGLSYQWNWGDLAFVKDHIQWGDNQNGSNIFSGRTPSFPLLKLHLNPTKWLDFNYYHAWLVSEAIDSVNSIFPPSGNPRTIHRRKYMAANMYTIKPFKNLHISAGNSIVYGDMGVQAAYLIPFLFYKSVVHTLHWKSSFQNNAMFLNISSRQIKHVHLYATYFVDEFSVKRIKDPNRHNFTSFKGGFSLSQWPIHNIFLGAEYTRTNPITFLHDEPTTSFESNRYNLGHYLKDNAEEFFVQLKVYPYKTTIISVSWLYAQKGNYYEYIRGRKNPKIDEHPVLKDITWSRQALSFGAQYQPFTNTKIFTKYILNNINGFDVDGFDSQYYLDKFSPAYLHGKRHVFELGLGLGF